MLLYYKRERQIVDDVIGSCARVIAFGEKTILQLEGAAVTMSNSDGRKNSLSTTFKYNFVYIS